MSSRRKSFTMRLAIAFGFFGYAAAARSKYSHISGSWHMTDVAEYGRPKSDMYLRWRSKGTSGSSARTDSRYSREIFTGMRSGSGKYR